MQAPLSILSEPNYEGDLKRYTADIYRSSNLDSHHLRVWFKKNKLAYLANVLINQDLHTFWRTHQNGSDLIEIAIAANIPRKKLVLAACACARLALKYVPAGEERPRRAIETAEAWTRGEATLEEVEQAAANAANAAAHAADAAAAAAAAHAAHAAAAAHAAHAAYYAAAAAAYAAYAANAANAASYYAASYYAAYAAAAYAASYAGVPQTALAEAVRSVISPIELRPRL